MSANDCTTNINASNLLSLKLVTSSEAVDMRKRWTPLLDLLAVHSEEADGTPASLMIVAHVTYRSALLKRVLHRWVNSLEALHQRELRWANVAEGWYTRRRLYLFFRAWQWRHDTRLKMIENDRGARAHCLLATQKRALVAWIAWRDSRRKLRNAVRNLCSGIEDGRRMEYWRLWKKFSARRVAYRRLAHEVALRVLIRVWVLWKRLLVRSKRRRLLLGVVVLHTPRAWTRGKMSGLLLGTGSVSMSARLEVSASTGGLCLALRFYFIQWMGETALRRGRRLLRYEHTVQKIKERLVTRTLASRYQTWLLYTANTIQCRRVLSTVCRRYFHKWSLFTYLEDLCRRHRFVVDKQVRLFALRTWFQRTQSRQEYKHRLNMADEIFARTLQKRQRHECFLNWRGRLLLREEHRKLESEMRDRRVELLRDLAVNRILHGVLLNFCDPSVLEATDSSNERHIQTVRDEGRGTTMQRLGEGGVTVRSGAYDDSGLTVKLWGGDNSRRGNPAVVLHHRLVNQYPPIPLGVGFRSAQQFSVASERHACLPGPTPSLEGKSTLSASSTLAPIVPLELSPPPSHVTPLAPSSSASECSRLKSFFPDVVEGRKLVDDYRVMLATAPSEREEMQIVRAKLDLYKMRRQRSGGALSTDDELDEGRQAERLVTLQLRELDRRALRARIEQLTKHLEVVLKSTTPSDSGFH